MKKYSKVFSVAFISAFFLSACEMVQTDVAPQQTQAANLFGQTAKKQPEGELEVHFIDVGQGDAILIRCGDEAMQIDFGDNDKGTLVQDYLEKEGIEKLSYAIGTHPDADHIGGMDVILYKFDTDTIFMPDVTSDTATYRDVIQVCKNKEYVIEAPDFGAVYELGDATFQILCPVADDYGDKNSYSIGIRLVYGETSFVMCGDATKESEQEMLCSNEVLKADVLKLSHHGSNTSNSAEFLDAVNPDYAVISCGKNNSYGHPHKEVMQRVEDREITVYRTDEQGTIVATSDGKNITWNVNAWEVGERYVINTGTKKVHEMDCSFAENIKEENREEVTKTLEELLEEGYSPCQKCMD